MKFRTIAIAILFASLATLGQTATAGQDGVAGPIEQSIASVSGELKEIFRYPVDHPTDVAWAGLGLLGLMAADVPLTRFYQNHVAEPFSGFHVSEPPRILPGSIGSGPDGWLVFALASTYAGGLVTQDDRMQRTGLAAGKAAAYSVLVSQLVLKTLTGRSRPNPKLGEPLPQGSPYTNNPYDFGHSPRPSLNSTQAGTALPSFHFTVYFAVARTYSVAYDNAWLPYGLAAIALLSESKGHNHWVSDMVAGATIGTVIGNIASQNLRSKSTQATGGMFLPTFSANGAGLVYFRSF